jgi:hypothetical protein
MCSSLFFGLAAIVLQWCRKTNRAFLFKHTWSCVRAFVLKKRQRECTGITLLLVVVVVVEHFESLQTMRPLLPSVYWCASDL